MATIDEISNAFYNYSIQHYEEELKNSEKPSEKSFPAKSTFQEDFQTNINTVYNEINRTYPPEQANYVYKTLLANLNKQSQNPGQSKIVDLSKGKINVQNLKAYSKKVQETLKTRHPERFEVKETLSEDKTSIYETKKEIDFNNPEEKKAYFDKLYKGLSNCKTKQEKQIYIQENFGIPLENMTEEQQAQVISRFEKRERVVKLTETLDKEAIRKENPDLDDEKIEQLIEDIAAKQYALENDTNVKVEINNNNEMIELENIESEILKLKEESDEIEKEDIRKQLADLEKQKATLVNKIALSKEEVEKVSENVQEKNKIIHETTEKLQADEKHLEESELKNDDLTDLFTEEEDLSDLFDAPIHDAEQKEEVSEQPILADKKIFINPILTGADENDLKQEDYTMEIEEKDGLWNRIKNGISKIKDFISEKIGLTQNKQLKGQAYLNSGEENIKSADNSAQIENKFDASLIVTEEIQEQYRKEYEATKKTQKQSSVLEVDKNTGQSVEV